MGRGCCFSISVPYPSVKSTMPLIIWAVSNFNQIQRTDEMRQSAAAVRAWTQWRSADAGIVLQLRYGIAKPAVAAAHVLMYQAHRSIPSPDRTI